MLPPPSVVLFGRDAHLLQTRGWLLASTGPRVTIVLDLSELLQVILTQPCDLLILCHSLTSSDCAGALSLASRYAPKMRIVGLESGDPLSWHAFPPEVVISETSPARFVSTVQSLLIANSRTNTGTPHQKEIDMAQYSGTVKWFNNAKGYGFVGRDDGGPDVFTHYTSIQSDGYKTLKEGQPVSFDIVQSEKGPQADKVKLVDDKQKPLQSRAA